MKQASTARSVSVRSVRDTPVTRRLLLSQEEHIAIFVAQQAAFDENADGGKVTEVPMEIDYWAAFVRRGP
jgi:hypothetical protein